MCVRLKLKDCNLKVPWLQLSTLQDACVHVFDKHPHPPTPCWVFVLWHVLLWSNRHAPFYSPYTHSSVAVWPNVHSTLNSPTELRCHTHLATCAVGVTETETHWPLVTSHTHTFQVVFLCDFDQRYLKDVPLMPLIRGSNWCVIKVRGDTCFSLIPHSPLVSGVLGWQLHNCTNGGGRTLQAGDSVRSSLHQLSFSLAQVLFLSSPRALTQAARVDRLITYCI